MRRRVVGVENAGGVQRNAVDREAVIEMVEKLRKLNGGQRYSNEKLWEARSAKGAGGRAIGGRAIGGAGGLAKIGALPGGAPAGSPSSGHSARGGRRWSRSCRWAWSAPNLAGAPARLRSGRRGPGRRRGKR